MDPKRFDKLIQKEDYTTLDKEWPTKDDSCYDCGSTIPGHHTKLCDFALPTSARDLPANRGTQHWTGKMPKVEGKEKNMKTFVWDDIASEITELDPDGTPLPAWSHQYTYPNGVRRLESDRGHVSLEVEAETKEEADAKFAEYCEEYVEDQR